MHLCIPALQSLTLSCFVALRANETQLKHETGFNSERARDSRLMADPDSFFSFLLYTLVVSLS